MNMEEYIDSFYEDTIEHLDNFENSLLELEKDLNSSDHINTIFRSLHTMKGMAGMMGYVKFQTLAHSLEDVLHDVRDKKINMTKKILDLLFLCHDLIRESIDSIREDKSDEKLQIDNFLTKIKEAIDQRNSNEILQKQDVKPSNKLSINESDKIILDEKSVEFNNLMYIKASIDPASPFKDVRAFMVLKLISDKGFLLKSFPNYEMLKSGSVTFNADSLECIALLNESAEDISNEMSKISEINNININQFKYEVKPPEISKSDEVKNRLSSFFKEEINKHTLKIDIETELAKSHKLFDDYIFSIRKSFHTIRGLSGFLDNSLIRDISNKTELFLELYLKGVQFAPDQLLEVILNSNGYIKDIMENPSILSNPEFEAVINQYMRDIDSLNPKYFEESIPEEVKENPEETKIPEKIISYEQGIIRLNINKIDKLVDMISELMIVQSQIEQKTIFLTEKDNDLRDKLLRANRILTDIQNFSMLLKNIKFQQIFDRIKTECNIIEKDKSYNIEYIGGETEIDFSIAEKIYPTLLHIIINAINHGIESETERKLIGKNTTGEIKIKAYNVRGYFNIEISDDGRGINEELLNSSSKSEVIERLIYNDTLSISKSLKEVINFGTKVELFSKKETGTSFRFKIPINMAIMNGTLVNISDITFIIPTLNINEIVQIDNNNFIKMKGKQEMIKVRDKIIEIIPLNKIFNKKDIKINNLMVILEVNKELKALPVEEIIGRKEVVIKPLGNEFMTLKFLSGASILGDGKVALIMDVESIVKY